MKRNPAQRKRKTRLLFLSLVYTAAVLWLFVSVGGLQVTQGDKFRQAVDAEAAVTTRTVTTLAPRGNIYDSQGVPLIQSTLSYAAELQYASWDKTAANDTLLQTLNILETHGFPFTDRLPVTGGSFPVFMGSDEENAKLLASFLEAREWNADIDAQTLYQNLLARYDIPESYNVQEARAVVGIRYEMEIQGFSKQQSVPLAENLDHETVVALASHDLPGVEIVTRETRTYETDLLAHTLGRIGYIYAEDADYYKSLGYPADAKVGLFGIEKACETELRGTDGVLTRSYDAEGRLLSETVETPVQAGDDVYLTIDLRLQQAAENSLKTRIEEMRTSGGTGSGAGGGAAVVMQVGTGSVLASASYPTYSLATFSADYQSLLTAENKPMVNRAANGLYAPGSVFKMVTAAAALQDGIIDTETEIVDEGVYSYYAPDYLYHCWLYNETGGNHGSQTVAEALQNSCNCFFYEAGRLTGIDRIAYYASQFGLGQKTGLEISESEGTLASPDSHSTQWYPGDTLMAAIGQSDNLFTPVQLANYIATLCSGGKRYEAHLIDSIYSASGELLQKNEPKELSDVNLTAENLNAILEGMRRVTEDGTASKVFENYPVNVIGKTGSAQVSDGEANGVFVLAAPAENPEIAIAVVVEHGGSGNNVAWIARDILDAYLALNP